MQRTSRVECVHVCACAETESSNLLMPKDDQVAYGEDDENFLEACNRLQAWSSEVEMSAVAGVTPATGLPCRVDQGRAREACSLLLKLTKGNAVNVGHVPFPFFEGEEVQLPPTQVATSVHVPPVQKPAIAPLAQVLPKIAGLDDEEASSEEEQEEEDERPKKKLKLRDMPIEIEDFKEKKDATVKTILWMLKQQNSKLKQFRVTEKCKDNLGSGQGSQEFAVKLVKLTCNLGLTKANETEITMLKVPAEKLEAVVARLADALNLLKKKEIAALKEKINGREEAVETYDMETFSEWATFLKSAVAADA